MNEPRKRACRICGAFIVPGKNIEWVHVNPQPDDEPIHWPWPL